VRVIFVCFCVYLWTETAVLSSRTRAGSLVSPGPAAGIAAASATVTAVPVLAVTAAHDAAEQAGIAAEYADVVWPALLQQVTEYAQGVAMALGINTVADIIATQAIDVAEQAEYVELTRRGVAPKPFLDKTLAKLKAAAFAASTARSEEQRLLRAEPAEAKDDNAFLGEDDEAAVVGPVVSPYVNHADPVNPYGLHPSTLQRYKDMIARYATKTSFDEL
jgi:hypothetical protein